MDATEIAIKEHEIRLIGGIDQDGSAVVATTFIVTGTDNELIPYYDGLAMLEVAKHDFIRRWGIHKE